VVFGRAEGSRAHTLAGIHKIRHVVVVMQENRSFDSYFGTYPGADGLPRRNGRFTVCVPDPRTHICVRPFHDSRNRNSGGPHEHLDAVRDVNGSKMDGFIREARRGRVAGCETAPDSPLCSLAAAKPDVMGYHDAREIPNYWAYARNFVLQDRIVRVGLVLEPAVEAVPALGVVGPLPPRGRRLELRQRPRESARAAARAAEPHKPQAELRLDRPHLPAAPSPRVVALLPFQGRPAGL
jgi:hypothetical protein